MPSEPIKQMFFAFIKEFLKSFESKKDTQVNVLQKFLEAEGYDVSIIDKNYAIKVSPETKQRYVEISLEIQLWSRENEKMELRCEATVKAYKKTDPL